MTTFLPLILVLGISMCKEAFEDFGRYRQDREVNARKVAVYDPSERRWVQKAWKHVRVRLLPSAVASHRKCKAAGLQRSM